MLLSGGGHQIIHSWLLSSVLKFEKTTRAMSYEEIHEPIEVITFFEQGKLHPLRFKWKGAVYKVKRVNSSWSVQEGLSRRYHFSVTAHTPDCFEIIFDTADFNWQLARVYLEG